MRPKSMKGVDVLEFFKDLREKTDGPIAVILDNATIHKTKMVREYYTEVYCLIYVKIIDLNPEVNFLVLFSVVLVLF